VAETVAVYIDAYLSQNFQGSLPDIFTYKIYEFL